MISVMKSLPFIAVLIVFISCGKSVKDKTDEEIQEEVISDGTYSAWLLPMNDSVSNRVSGDVKVKKYGDDFRVEVKLKGSPGGVHKQYLQTGTSCKAIGDRLVPFDDDLSGQLRGHSHFPSGNYHYKRSTSYYLMLSDLHLPDDVNGDQLVKLSEWDLPLERRAVTVYARGSSGDVLMACGVLTKISTNESGDAWNETSPAPRTPDSDHVRPRPRPRPPRTTPAPVPEVREPEPDSGNNSSWWERMRERWRRLRDRIRGREPQP